MVTSAALRLLAPALLASVSLLPACKVNQENEVGVYRRVLESDMPEGVSSLMPDEPLTLDRALVLANRDNETLDIEGEEYLQAIIEKKRIFTNFLPTVSLSPGYLVAGTGDRENGFAAGRDGDFEDSGVVTLRGDYLFSPSDVASYGAQGRTVEQRRALLLDVKASLLLDVAQAFYQVLRSQAQVRVLENSLGVQEERVRDVGAQVEAGTVRPLDLAQARAQSASTRVELERARNDVKNGRSVLAFLIGAREVSGELIDRFEAPAAPDPIATYQDRAAEQRQDLVAAIRAVGATRQAVDAAFAQYYPSVSLNLDYFVYSSAVPDASIYAALLELNIPVFTAGRIHQDVRTAWSEFRQAKADESLTRRRVRQDVELAYQDLTSSAIRVQELQTAVQAAQEAFDQAADLVQFGRATNLERLVAQNELLEAQLDMTSEVFDRKVFYLNLKRAAGELTLNLASTEAGDVATPPQPEAMN